MMCIGNKWRFCFLAPINGIVFEYPLAECKPPYEIIFRQLCSENYFEGYANNRNIKFFGGIIAEPGSGGNGCFPVLSKIQEVAQSGDAHAGKKISRHRLKRHAARQFH
jgi:hypothetical protein